jgi:hypothetical protein
VLNKCANPACLSPFRKLNQGKLFLVETEAQGGSGLRRASWGGRPSRRIEYYWLCDGCAFVLTLSYAAGQGVITVPRGEPATKVAAMTGHVREMPASENSSGVQGA